MSVQVRHPSTESPYQSVRTRIRGPRLLWIQNFLTTLTQKVVVDGSFSDTAHVGSGVPQGIQYLAQSYFYAIFMTSHPRSHLMFDSLLTTATFIGP